MLFDTTYRRVPARALPAALAAVFAVLALALAPAPALALETAKCTARPNADTGSEVLGGVETRLTWEGQAAADEQVSKLTLTLPDGTDFSVDDAKVTILTGEDLMTREKASASITADGQNVVVSFDEPASAGAYIRLEVYEVSFPASGGDLQPQVSYELEGSSEVTVLSDVPTITVTTVSPTEQLANYLEEQDWVQQWNSNKFCRLFLNPPILVSSFPVVFQGFLMAVAIVVVAFPLAIPFGFLLALMRISKSRVLRGLSSVYVNIVRGTPAFLQIYIAFFGLPLAGVQIPNYPLGVIVLAMNSAAYLCEIFRAGVQAIPKGQTEAARSLGMSAGQTMVYIIIPQTFRNVLPTMTSEFILLYKDTSLLAAVGVMEVVMYAKTIVASTGSITPYIVAALFYLVVTLPLAKVVGVLEGRLTGNGGSPKKRKKQAPAPAAAVAGSEQAGVIDGDHIIGA